MRAGGRIIILVVFLLPLAAQADDGKQLRWELSAGVGATESGVAGSLMGQFHVGPMEGNFEIQGGERPLRFLSDAHLFKGSHPEKTWKSENRELTIGVATEAVRADYQLTFNDFNFAKKGTECFGNSHLLLSSEVGLDVAGKARRIQGELRVTGAPVLGTAYDSDGIALVLGLKARVEGTILVALNPSDAIRFHGSAEYTRDLAHEIKIPGVSRTTGDLYAANGELSYVHTTRRGLKLSGSAVLELHQYDVLPVNPGQFNWFVGRSYYGGARGALAF